MTWFDHKSALETLPPPLRPALEQRLLEGVPSWTPWTEAEAPADDELWNYGTMGLPNVVAWAYLGEWEPGTLWALRQHFGNDGDAAVVVLKVEPEGRKSWRLVRLGTFEL
jgi:hypothetical protein